MVFWRLFWFGATGFRAALVQGVGMAQQDVIAQLGSRFERPLEGAAQRRIIIWHDPDGSFEEQFDQLAANGFDASPGSRSIAFAKVQEGGAFELKRRVYRLEAQSDFLIYTRAHKDLSANALMR